jgi:precorrin-6A/cobalt-precorrin-6A reductase
MILVLGGTSDSLEICDKINKYKNLSYILSVTTSYGENLATKHAKKVINGRLSETEMMDFINENNIKKIIDATHPYAIEVSKNAIKCAKQKNIDYIRYERKSLIEQITYKNKYIVSDIKEACKIATQKGKNIFIGTGSKNLPQIVECIPDRNLIARVLPTSEVILSCEKLGFLKTNPAELHGGNSIEEAANIFTSILQGKGTKAQNEVVIANSAFALCVYFPQYSIEECIAMAKDSLMGGKALNIFKKLLDK